MSQISVELAARLENGWIKVENAKATGDPRAEAWETFWIDLLREYENAADHERSQEQKQGVLL